LYAKVRREVHDQFVCRADRSKPMGVAGLALPGDLEAAGLSE
jgi:hypothetical protein